LLTWITERRGVDDHACADLHVRLRPLCLTPHPAQSRLEVEISGRFLAVRRWRQRRGANDGFELAEPSQVGDTYHDLGATITARNPVSILASQYM
jgi:hypothetical protein